MGTAAAGDSRAKIDAQIDGDYNAMVDRHAAYMAKEGLTEEVDRQKWFPPPSGSPSTGCGCDVRALWRALPGALGRGVGYHGRSSALRLMSAWACAHQYQRGGEVPVDNSERLVACLSVPDGYQWGSLDDQPIFANIAHVAQHPAYYNSMWPLWVLAQDIWGLCID